MDFSQLFDDESMSDLQVVFSGEKPPLHLHKLFLVSTCGFFKAMFSSGMREANSGVVDLSEHEFSPVLPAVLRFVYTGTLPVFPDSQLGHAWRAAHFLGSNKALLAVEGLLEKCCTSLTNGTAFAAIAGPLSVVESSQAWTSATACFVRNVNTAAFVEKLPLDEPWCLALCTNHCTVTAPTVLRALLKQQGERAAPVAALTQKIAVGAIEVEHLVALSRVALDERHDALLQRVAQEVEVRTTRGEQVPPEVLAALPIAVVQPLVFKILAQLEARASKAERL